jgi:hypothetical protein
LNYLPCGSLTSNSLINWDVAELDHSLFSPL